MKNFNRLPTDVVRYLFLNLSTKTIYNILLIKHKKYKKHIFNDLFWMNKVLMDFEKSGHIPKKLNDEKIIWKTYYKNISGHRNLHTSIVNNDVEKVKVLLKKNKYKKK